VLKGKDAEQVQSVRIAGSDAEPAVALLACGMHGSWSAIAA